MHVCMYLFLSLPLKHYGKLQVKKKLQDGIQLLGSEELRAQEKQSLYHLPLLLFVCLFNFFQLIYIMTIWLLSALGPHVIYLWKLEEENIFHHYLTFQQKGLGEGRWLKCIMHLSLDQNIDRGMDDY